MSNVTWAVSFSFLQVGSAESLRAGVMFLGAFVISLSCTLES
jgi:hypothetical protein